MISTEDPTVIVHIRVEPVMVLTNGGNVKAFRLAQGFALAEYVDGNVFQITNPLAQWIDDVRYQTPAGATNTVPRIFFLFDAGGPAPNPGQDDSERSLHDVSMEL